MNLNDFVKVILTEKGAMIMNEKEKHYSNIVPDYKEHKYSEGDELITQLWMLFEDFGEFIKISDETPFKNNEITITD